MKYWLCLTTKENWEIIRDNNLWAVSQRYEKTIKKMKNGDRILFYTKQVVGKIGIEKREPEIVAEYEVASNLIIDDTDLFVIDPLKQYTKEKFPLRLKIKPIATFSKPKNFKSMINQLEFILNKQHWASSLQGRVMIELPEVDYNLIKSY